MSEGQWVGKKEQLALIVSKTSQWRVETWIDGEDVERLEIGQSASFQTDSATGSTLHLSVAAIDKDASRLLPQKRVIEHLWRPYIDPRKKWSVNARAFCLSGHI